MSPTRLRIAIQIYCASISTGYQPWSIPDCFYEAEEILAEEKKRADKEADTRKPF